MIGQFAETHIVCVSLLIGQLDKPHVVCMLNRQTRCCCCCCLHYFAEVPFTSITPLVIPSVGACPNEGSPGEQQHSAPSGDGLRALLGRSFIGMFEICQLCLFCICDSRRIIKEVVVVVVFFTLTDRASTIHSNTRGCQSGTWSQKGTKVNGSHHGDTRYSDQQGSKSRQKVMRLYKRWHRPITKRFIKPLLLHIESSLDRLGLLSPTHDQRSQQQIGHTRSNQFLLTITSFSRPHIVQK